MVRIIIKGGIWRNTEDEILKAAISKYGKNQWARISSLLVRKTPKQCKARWYEWLDPSIKKVEWSKTEDEKLLHLAKLMPTQWRTIAPIVGRTATQCLDRYQKLLDEAEAKEGEESLGLAGPSGPESAPAAEDVRRLRPGEVDPDPETKPARPDPIDMDEDEKEMLSEARARLANTQGKKAKRKARERQMEEARRLAMLQKKRELKAAGIMSKAKPKKKNNAMDYNADIPFNKQPAPGFYDTSAEKTRGYHAPVGELLSKLEKRKADSVEDEKRKKSRKDRDDKDKGGDKNATFVAARNAQIQKLQEAEQISSRRHLVLPEAQVGEQELEEIVKIGQAGERSRELVEGDDEASGRLLGDYESLGRAKMARTPNTAPQHDNIMAETLNLRNIMHQQTPLLGDENTPLHLLEGRGSGYESATPSHSVAATPNPLATPFRGTGGVEFGATPRSDAGSAMSGATPLRTPMRDNLNINTLDPGMTPVGDTPAQARRRAKDALRRGFSSLPKAENNFDFVLPDEEEVEEDAENVPLSEEDQAEKDARDQRLAEEEAAKALARRSSAVKQGLPRPIDVDVEALLRGLMLVSVPSGDADRDTAQRLVDVEFARLVEHDSIAHPLPGTSRSGASTSGYVAPDDDSVATARSLVHSELASSLGFPGANEDAVKRSILAHSDEHGLALLGESIGWAKTRASLAFSAETGSWVDADALSPADRIAGYAALIRQDKDTMIDVATKAGKTEKKLNKLLGGYQAVNAKIQKRISDAFEDLQRTEREIEAFARLRQHEGAATPRRIEGLELEVGKLQSRERDLQMRYAELDAERNERRARLDAQEEERLIAEAEAALDAQEAAAAAAA